MDGWKIPAAVSALCADFEPQARSHGKPERRPFFGKPTLI
jgi:hypothetical protein